MLQTAAEVLPSLQQCTGKELCHTAQALAFFFLSGWCDCAITKRSLPDIQTWMLSYDYFSPPPHPAFLTVSLGSVLYSKTNLCTTHT